MNSIMEHTMIYIPLGEATIDLWALEPSDRLEVTVAIFGQEGTGDAQVAIALRNPVGRTVTLLEPGRPFCTEWQAGFWQVRLTPKQTPGHVEECRAVIEIRGAYPFVVPGPGVIPSHFAHQQPWLRFPAAPDAATAFYVPVPSELELIYLGGWLSGHETFRVEYPDGTSETLLWHLPKQTQHGAVIPVKGRGGWWKITLLPVAQTYYFTTGWSGLPLFFQQPPSAFPFARISARVLDQDENPVDARVDLHRDGAWQALQVALVDEPVLFHAVPGCLMIVASRGLEFGRSAQLVAVAPGEHRSTDLSVEPAMRRRPGWACGDHHMHSFYEDGAFSPLQIAQASRGEGLDYIFLTDTPEPLLQAGLQSLNVPGRFLALPGQELYNPDCHFNALNTQQHIEHPSFETIPQSYPGPGEWMPQIEAQSTPNHPTMYMLNHPAHFPRLSAAAAYFRSWWLADKYPQITIVENSTLAPWYERLKAGRRITHLWTTDSHDAGLLPPGARRTYIYIGGKLSEEAIVRGIKSGRSFNTREPGAWLQVEVNGATMGQTAENPDGLLDVRISCQASIPLERIEIICDGEPVYACLVNDARKFEGQASLYKPDARWLIALAYVDRSLKNPDGHVGPLDTDGLLAFTNPVYINSKQGSS